MLYFLLYLLLPFCIIFLSCTLTFSFIVQEIINESFQFIKEKFVLDNEIQQCKFLPGTKQIISNRLCSPEMVAIATASCYCCLPHKISIRCYIEKDAKQP